VVETFECGDVPENHFSASDAYHHQTLLIDFYVADCFLVFFDVSAGTPTAFVPKSDHSIF
jgi:hypothetical protein